MDKYDYDFYEADTDVNFNPVLSQIMMKIIILLSIIVNLLGL